MELKRKMLSQFTRDESAIFSKFLNVRGTSTSLCFTQIICVDVHHFPINHTKANPHGPAEANTSGMGIRY
jgi:hypothetical protein